jgi:hypothetical protein
VEQAYGSINSDAGCNGGDNCASVTLGIIGFNSGSINVASQLENYVLGAAPLVTNPTGTYIVAASGRVTFSAGATPPVLYLATPQSNTEPITGFLVGTNAAADSGTIEAGANSNVLSTAFSSNYIFGSVDGGDATVPDQAGVLQVNSGNVTGYQYFSNIQGLVEGALTGAPVVTITNTPLPGFGNVGPNTIAVTDGTRLWFFDTGTGNTSAASIEIVQP